MSYGLWVYVYYVIMKIIFDKAVFGSSYLYINSININILVIVI